MHYSTRLFLLTLLVLLSTQPLAEQLAAQAYESGAAYNPPPAAQQPADYGTVIGNKLKSGMFNLTLSPLEIPKNVINTTNETNLALGATGGVLKGLLHMAGRFMAGAVDTLTFPIPSEPITNPPYPWQNYKTDTTYNPLFKMKK